MGIERSGTAGSVLESVRFDERDALWMKHRGWWVALRTQEEVGVVEVYAAFCAFRP